MIDELRAKPILGVAIDFFGNLYLAFWNSFFCYFPSYFVRNFVLRYCYFVNMGSNVNIHSGVKLLKPWNISIGNSVNVQMNSLLDGRGGLSIGNNVDITLGVKILTQQHCLQDGLYTTESKPVVINDNAVLGSFCLLLPGVTVGEGAVVGAGSVVPRSIPSWKIAAGNPAVIKKDRNTEINYNVGFKRYFH